MIQCLNDDMIKTCFSFEAFLLYFRILNINGYRVSKMRIS